MTTMTELYANFVSTTLASPINSSAASLTVASGTGASMPSPGANQYFRLTLNDALTGLVYETIWVTSRSGDTCSGLLRGQESTTATSWLAGDKIYEAPSAGAMQNLTQQFQDQSNALKYVADTGSANAYVIAPSPTNFATPVAGAILYFLAANPNTSSSTLTVNGGSTYPLLGVTRVALQGGEIKKFCAVTYDATLSSYVLLWSTGGNVPTLAPTNSLHAVNLAYANATYAALNGNASNQFAASQINTGIIHNSAGGILVLESPGGSASVNLADSAYAPFYCGFDITSLESAVNLQYANLTYAPINGSFSNNFDVENLFLDGGNIAQESGSFLVLQANSGIDVQNLAGTAPTPVTCGASQNAQQAVIAGQLFDPQVVNATTGGADQTLSLTVSFTASVAGVLLVGTSTNYAIVDPNPSFSTLYVNGSQIFSGQSDMTKVYFYSAFIPAGTTTIEVVGASFNTFSLFLTAIYVPNAP